MLQRISWSAVALAIILGIGMISLGGIFIVMGAGAKGDIQEALRKEEVITSKDASLPGVLVEDVATARAQQNAIEGHTFGSFGPYAGMERGDPNRDVYLKGLTLRNSLNLAIVGFGLSDLAIGLGAVTIVLGIIIAGLSVPLHILITERGIHGRL